MKKLIALILVLVMVLSLATVAFAEVKHTLFRDTVGGIFNNVMIRVNKYIRELGSLINSVIGYHDDVVYGIAGAIDQMALSIPGRNCIARRAACCVHSMASVFDYVYRIGCFAD